MTPVENQLRLLKLVPNSKWYYHETYICRLLDISKKKEGLTQQDQLNTLIVALQKGFSGNKRKEGTFYSTGLGPIAIKNQDAPNELGVYMLGYGAKESFQVSYLSSAVSNQRIPRYFSVGKSPVLKDIKIKNQCDLTRAVTGLDKQTLDIGTQQRRQKTWLAWSQNNDDDGAFTSFKAYDLPDIMERFQNLFTDNRPTQVQKEIRHVLLLSNLLRPKDRVARSIGFAAVPGKRKASISVASPKRQRVSTSPIAAISPIHCLPDYLLLCALRKQPLAELASIEFVLHLTITKHLSLDEIRNSFHDAQVCEPKSLTIESCLMLSARLLDSAKRNVELCRTEILGPMPDGLFLPKQHDLLYQWINDGKDYTRGSRLPASNYEKNASNHQLSLTDEASHYIRHIICVYKISLCRFASLWNCFSILLLRRPLSMEEFSSTDTIRIRIERLAMIDDHRFATSFEEYILTQTKHGFQRLAWYTSDDSKHCDKRSRHVLIMSAHGNVSSNSEYPDPSFHLLTTSVAAKKNSAGNAQLNLDTLKANFSLKVLGHFGGGVTDNAHDALDETVKTFNLLMDELRSSDNPELKKMTHAFGVERRPIKFGDPFHIDNLVMTHASLGSFGETDRENNSEIHHRQLLQSMHDIHSTDAVASQNVMDEVLVEDGKLPGTVIVKTVRERQQRWGVNQANAVTCLTTGDIETTGGIPVLTEWARRMHEYGDRWVRRAAGEVMTMFGMPTIMLGLHFEAELGKYFKTTMKWHSSPGPLNSRAGFRIWELHALYFNFSAPWWELAKTSPEKQFPKSFKYLEEKLPTDQREMKRAQMISGIEAGYKEFVKMSKLLFSAPIVFLVIVDAERGASFFRALLSVLSLNGIDLGDGWGSYDYHPPLLRPMEEQVFFDLLVDDGENVAHFFQQLGLLSDCVRPELQRLSNERPSMRDAGITVFMDTYPIIFEVLGATFSLMMHNSRLAEQVHGILRANLQSGVALSRTDAMTKYLTNEEYGPRQERRDSVRTRQQKRDEMNKEAGKEVKRRVWGGGIKHDQFKTEQQMVGIQLLSSGKKYSSSVLKQLPTSFLIAMGTKHLKEIGTLYQDKKLASDKAEVAKKQRSTQTRTEKSMAEWREKSKMSQVGNDATWENISPEERQRRSDLEKLSNKSFWEKLKVKDGFKTMMKDVLPMVWDESCERKSKKALCTNVIAPFLVKVNAIADKKMSNVLDNRNLEGLDRADILAHFVLYKKTMYLEGERLLSRRRAAATSQLMGSCGTVVNNKFFGNHGLDDGDTTNEEVDMDAAD